MHKLILIPLTLLLLGGKASAQAVAADSAQMPYHSLGLFIGPNYKQLFAGRAFPLGMLYRQQVAPRHWLRVGASGYYGTKDHEGVKFPPLADSTLQTHEIGVRLGYEYDIIEINQWRFYVGAEIAFNSSTKKVGYKEYRLLTEPNNVYTIIAVPFDGKDKTRRYSGAALLGVQYQFPRRITLSVESRVLVERTRFTKDGYGEVSGQFGSQSYLFTIGSKDGEPFIIDAYTKLGLLPVGQIRIDYAF